MWFKFPEGTEQISIQRQIFKPLYVQPDGAKLFRAPDHFAAIILDLPGFAAAAAPEDAGDLGEDEVLSEDSEAIVQLGGQVTHLELKIGHLEADLAEMRAERDDLKVKLNDSEAERKNLVADVEDLEKQLKAAVPAPAPAQTSALPLKK